MTTIARVDECNIAVHRNTFPAYPHKTCDFSPPLLFWLLPPTSVPRLACRGREFAVEHPMGSGEDNPGGTGGGVGGIVRGAVLKALVVFGGVLLIRRLRRSTTRWDHARAVADALSGEKVSAIDLPRGIELASVIFREDAPNVSCGELRPSEDLAIWSD